MKPALILQNLSDDGPAHLATWLGAHGVPFDVRNAERGEPFPRALADHGALAVLGGEMSANDALPSLRQAESLIREAMGLGIPVLGHCLGGQLMARALGARVVASPAPEVGWHPIDVVEGELARSWFGAAGSVHVFQWHYEAFELPPGAERLAGSAACPNQAFGLGPHLAMQFHVELDRAKLERWLEAPGERHAAARTQHPTVHGADAMRGAAAPHLAAQQRLADRIYRRWIDAARARSG